VVVTVDAVHTQTDTANLIVDAGGDYVFTIKKNQPNLYRDCTKLPWSKIPTHRSTETSHGRRATRTIKVTAVPAWIEFAGATQIAQIRRTITSKKNGVKKKTVEVVYVLTSADHLAATPAVLAGWVTSHWSIENRVHWVRDVTFDEDRSQVRTGSGPQVMATLRNTAISMLRLDGWSNIAAGLRHHARSPEAPLTLLLTC
jgi:predicted transposase YbfD/YdcC